MSTTPRGLVLPLGNGQLLLGPEATLLLSMSLRAAERVGRFDGVQPTRAFMALRHLVDQAAAEAASAVGTTDLPRAGEMSSSAAPVRIGLANPVGTAEASLLLGVSDRAVRDRCRRGVFASAVLQGRSWLIEAEEVQAAALGRRAGGDEG